jgi:hypothetical protein
VNSTSLLGAGDVAVQETLVSGTNIKTLNSTSLLGSGDIVLTANPSGVSGAIQFSNGSAFASDAANFFWDDTNNRLGIGTNAPTQALDVVGQGRFSDNILFTTDFKHIGRDLNNSSISFSSINSRILAKISTGGSFEVYNSASGTSRFTVSNGGQTTISGGGSTSATTSLLVQNSAGTALLTITDDGNSIFNSSITSTPIVSRTSSSTSVIELQNAGSTRRFRILASSTLTTFEASNTDGITTNSSLNVGGSTSSNASAILQADSTTKGFLPPRMTTTQKNAIASPATGLVVYDTTLGKLCVRTASAWETITSS